VVDSAPSFRSSNERQQKAWEVLGHATHDPGYVDPSTGDNALLALAQVKLDGKVPGKGSLLPQIRQYIKADVDLNHSNHAKEPALVAMIRERPWLGIDKEETGATMSMYLDALLWKDPEKKVRNKINVNLKNREGATALYYAATFARPDSVRSLIEAGANVNTFLGKCLRSYILTLLTS
jgi:ankyrin repeat protein